MKTIYIVIDKEGEPFVAAETLKSIIEQVDDFFGANEKFNHSAERLSWTRTEYSKFEDNHVGVLVYEYEGKEEKINIFNLRVEK